MKKYLSRLLCLIAALIMLVTFAGCGDSSQQGATTKAAEKGTTSAIEEKKPDPIKFVIWLGNADPGVATEEDPVHKYIRENLGVDIEYEYTAGDAMDKLNLFAASGDYPDALYSKDNEVLRKMALNGNIVELTGYLEKYVPDLYAYMKEKTNGFQYLPEQPGKYYYVPGGFGYSKENPLIEPMLGFRHDVWKEIGKPKPKTVEEFFEMAKKMQDMHPSEDGKKTYAFGGWFGDSWGQWAPYAIMRYAGVVGWWYESDSNNNWEVKYLCDSEPWLYAMRLLNKMLREGYADPEAAVMKHGSYMEKLRQGLILCNYYGGAWMDGDADAARKAAGKPEQRIVPYPYMTYANYSGQPLTGQYFPMAGGFNLYITKNCQNPEEIVKRLAWLYSDEGQVLTGMGVEGIHWTYDANGIRKPTDEVYRAYKEDSYYKEKTGILKYRIFGYKDGYDSKGDSYDITNNYYIKISSYDDIDKEILSDLGVKTYDELAKAGATRLNNFLVDVESQPQGTELSAAKTEMENSVAEYTAKLFIAKSDEEFDSVVAQWRNRMEKVGYQKVVENMNERIAKYVREANGNMW